MVLTIVLLCSVFSVSVYADEKDDTFYVNDVENSDDGYIMIGETPVIQQELTEDIIINAAGYSIETLIANSDNVVAYADITEGDYTSPKKIDAGLAGYKYKLHFHWIAEKNSDGEYIFVSITDSYVRTYTNPIILSLAWSVYSYDVDPFYYYDLEKKTVIFNIPYEFTVWDSVATEHHFESNFIHEFTVNDLQ